MKKIIRSADWWEYKLPPLLAIGYATALKVNGSFLSIVPHLLFLLLSLIIGAIYVSIINDITDIGIDNTQGKKNRMANVKVYFHWLLPITLILIGCFCASLLLPDLRSVILYCIPWVSFSLYSFKPVRLKDRGILGVFADASGSHIFTSLLMISSISFIAHAQMDWIWFISTGVWAMCYGIRGILWHQFHDRENDIITGTNTYASNLNPDNFKTKEIMIFVLEAISLLVMLSNLFMPLPVLFLGLYILLAFIRSKSFGYKSVLVISPQNQPLHILMADYYQVFLPISLLVTASIDDYRIWFILIAHILLFPKKLLYIIKDFWRYTKSRLEFLFN
ncbi:UbiA family prenyltransferase [Pedobacter sp. V48]|uniref:UbiA family prenyltransferase n=1 Tax=Pedobacter sp. V48 TaxID=509635 RepID=UPI0003E4AE3A|nr:UbiA family prenyltransferase [Pedobacter sp. V48]ETZ22615.1 hypothetical protein N824_22335 [Pedobacter sp. V48]